MNKIVRMQYPVDRLPQDLRPAAADENVTVTVEVASSAPITAAEWLAAIGNQTRPAADPNDDPVGRIRKLRDEWED